MREQTEQVINALGSTAEICRIFFNDLKEQNFTTNQALEITKTYLAIFVTTGLQQNNEPDERG
jgi:hypothetical protein